MKLLPINIKLDNTDRKILEILQLNAKITNAQLAKDISLSPAPTLERVKKLENSGIIKSYHASLDKEKIGLGVSTFVLVTLKGHNKANIDLFTNAIDEIPQPLGTAVIIEAAHQCMTTRGVQKAGVTMVTSRMLGAFRDSGETRREFLAMIGNSSSGETRFG